MPYVNKYSREYIDYCRKKIDMQISSYRNLIIELNKVVVSADARLNSAIEEFEMNCFNNMVVALEAFFIDRNRTLELKDGNPLNEVRMIRDSIMTNDNKLSPDKSIEYKPDKSVLKYKIGDVIRLDHTDFTHLSDAFFDEIERKFL